MMSWIGGIIIITIMCATVLIGEYLHCFVEKDTGYFEKLFKHRLKDLEDQQKELTKEIQELKEIVKEQNSFNGFTIQK